MRGVESKAPSLAKHSVFTRVQPARDPTLDITTASKKGLSKIPSVSPSNAESALDHLHPRNTRHVPAPAENMHFSPSSRGSLTSHARPTAPMSLCTISLSSPVACEPMENPAAPSDTRHGVFGITRTTRLPGTS